MTALLGIQSTDLCRSANPNKWKKNKRIHISGPTNHHEKTLSLMKLNLELDLVCDIAKDHDNS